MTDRERLGFMAKHNERYYHVTEDEPMRKGKVLCHDLFDAMWKGKRKAQKKRKDLYNWLADQMGIPVEECHFGYFDIHQLREAYRLLMSVRSKEMCYDNNGRIYFGGC